MPAANPPTPADREDQGVAAEPFLGGVPHGAGIVMEAVYRRDRAASEKGENADPGRRRPAGAAGCGIPKRYRTRPAWHRKILQARARMWMLDWSSQLNEPSMHARQTAGPGICVRPGPPTQAFMLSDLEAIGHGYQRHTR